MRRVRARAWLGAALVVSGALAGCGTGERQFADLAELRATAPDLAAWLPAALTPDATLIRLRVHPGPAARAEGQFHFPSDAFDRLVAGWAEPALPLGDRALDAFATRKALRGYAPRLADDGARRWLLLCSAAKGRCYFLARAA